jgi:hypothetical protein
MYQTEDPFGDGIGGFYRYTPPVGGRLDDGGVLEMLSVSAPGSTTSTDLRTGQVPGSTYTARWVPIPDPDPTFTGNENVDVKAVFNEGAAQGEPSSTAWRAPGTAPAASSSPPPRAGTPAGDRSGCSTSPPRP